MDDDLYDLRITFRIKLKKWRIDDQNLAINREWALKVFDRNKEKWVNTATLDRPGEDACIEDIEVIGGNMI